MSEHRKKIKQHQDEIERLTKQLPALRAASVAALEVLSKSRQLNPVYPSAEVDAVANAAAAIDDLREQIAKLTRLAEWDEGIKNAPANLKAARIELNDADSDAATKRAKYEKLSAKFARLEAEHQQEREAADTKEKTAAQRYADALANGDEAAEEQAKSALRSSFEALELFKRARPSASAVLDAVKAELAKLEDSLTAAQQRQTDAKRELIKASRYLWLGRLEKASKELASIAAHVYSAEYKLGWHSTVDELHLPLHAPDGPRCIDRRMLVEIADQLSLEQLTAA